MVRLGVHLIAAMCTVPSLFQFQYGAIRRDRIQLFQNNYQSFNSSMVRLGGFCYMKNMNPL